MAHVSKLFVILISILVFSTVAIADTVPFRKQIVTSMEGGIDACKSRAIDIAKKEAISDVIAELTGDQKKSEQFFQSGNSDCCVVKIRVPKQPRNTGDGQCDVTVLLKIDTGRVEEALRKTTGAAIRKRDPIYVGGVVRFLVDGKLASAKRGYTPLAAAHQFNANLAELGINMVNLSALHDSFALQNFGSLCKVTGGKPVDCTEYKTYSQSIRNLLDNTRFGVEFADEFPDFKKFRDHGGWVLIGQVAVMSRGRDPEGIRYQAEVRTDVSLYNIEDGRILSADPDHKIVVSGDRQSIANTVALSDSVRNTAKKLADKLSNIENEKKRGS